MDGSWLRLLSALWCVYLATVYHGRVPGNGKIDSFDVVKGTLTVGMRGVMVWVRCLTETTLGWSIGRMLTRANNNKLTAELYRPRTIKAKFQCIYVDSLVNIYGYQYCSTNIVT